MNHSTRFRTAATCDCPEHRVVRSARPYLIAIMVVLLALLFIFSVRSIKASTKFSSPSEGATGRVLSKGTAQLTGAGFSGISAPVSAGSFLNGRVGDRAVAVADFVVHRVAREVRNGIF